VSLLVLIEDIVCSWLVLFSVLIRGRLLRAVLVAAYPLRIEAVRSIDFFPNSTICDGIIREIN